MITARGAASNLNYLQCLLIGKIYGWGRNQSGQLGQADSYMDIYSMEDFPRVIEASPTNDADDEEHEQQDAPSGGIFSSLFGGGKAAAAPKDKPAATKHHHKKHDDVKFIYITAGHGRSAAVSQSGELYTWGARWAHKPKLVDRSLFDGHKVWLRKRTQFLIVCVY